MEGPSHWDQGLGSRRDISGSRGVSAKEAGKEILYKLSKTRTKAPGEMQRTPPSVIRKEQGPLLSLTWFCAAARIGPGDSE